MRLVSIAAAVPLLVSCGGSNPAEPKPDTPSNAEDKRAGKDASKPAAAENTRAAGVSGTPLAGVTPELPHAMTDFRIEVGSLTSGFPRGWLLPDIP
ncbi:MAG: hypothetical protein JKY37_32600, partial [Nannocystaceae bacterium]|nr:hypothetical protein [Nannocystaceae bacterium]